MPEATVDGNGAVDAAAFQAVQPSEGPELVQLLTPEGERVDHPHYTLELTANPEADASGPIVEPSPTLAP